MLPGYNTDVQCQGSTYHIQTEDNGVSNPSIITLVYQGGAILARKKSDYRHLLKNPQHHDEVRRLMQDQHRDMIKLIMDGKLNTLQGVEPAAPAAQAQPAAPQSLDAAIMHFLAEIGD